MMEDQFLREQALNIQCSYLVQAPAGSGKTSLLVDRFVKILSQVRQPEECLAITFTRKASQEMRDRILKRLNADKGPAFKAALEHPERLKIMTIDAWCADLAARIPLLTHFGGRPKISEDPGSLYQKAVKHLLDDLYVNPVQQKWHSALAVILEHLGNHLKLFEELLLDLLPKREQWLPYIYLIKGNPDLVSLAHCIQSSLFDLEQDYLKQFNDYFKFVRLPSALEGSYESLDQIQNLANLLLTKEGKIRKKWQDLEEQNPDFLVLLHRIRGLPQKESQDGQLKIMTAMAEVMLGAVAYLGLVFCERAELDFQEVVIRAIDALGSEEAPTDLALILDHQIKHILMDEFQDTSVLQWSLFEKIIANWMPGDGKTLFLVGDPMQSIYRFRQSDVGIFLKIKEYGLPNINIAYLCLTGNFRSQALLVQALNVWFADRFPRKTDPSLGAVPFSSAIAQVLNDPRASFECWSHDKNFRLEAEKVVQIVKRTQRDCPQASIAVLVRNRSQLATIIDCFLAQGISYRGVELTSLLDNSTIHDAWMCLRALTHPGDQFAWLCFLKGPVMGLSLKEVTKVSEFSKNSPMGQVIEHRLKELYASQVFSSSAALRLNHLADILSKYRLDLFNEPLRIWFSKVWKALGGLQLVDFTTSEWAYQAFLDVLDEYSVYSNWDELYGLGDKLAKQYMHHVPSASDPAQTVELMTIHKAKGLEFDVVILPGLGKNRVVDKHPLFIWSERWREGRPYFLFSTIKQEGKDPSSLFEFLREEQQLAHQHEELRLLYVAVTRAKLRLHLIGTEAFFTKNNLQHLALDPQDFECSLVETQPKGHLWRLKDEFYLPRASCQHLEPDLSRLQSSEQTVQDLNRASNWEEHLLNLAP